IGMVEAPRAAVKEDDGRTLTHRVAFRHETRSVDVEPEAGSVHLNVHRSNSLEEGRLNPATVRKDPQSSLRRKRLQVCEILQCTAAHEPATSVPKRSQSARSLR